MSLDPLSVGVPLVAALLCLAYPAYHVRHIRLPRPDEWRELKGRIGDLTRDDIEATSYSDVTKQALELILTGRAGYGRLAQVPLALDHIQGAAESLSRTMRALGSQAVVIGLLGTVLAFFKFFSTGQQAIGTGQAAVTVVFSHLQPIYVVNGIAILLAVFFFGLALRATRIGDDASLAAAEAFHTLEESGQADLAPELVKALEVTAGQFQAFSQQLFQDQFSKIESLLGEVQALGTGLRRLVEQIVARSSNEQEVYQALLRQNSATVDALTARLDTGFQLLAQPFLQGIPAMQALAESSDGLRKVTDQVVHANIVQLSTQLKVAVSQLDRATRELPGAVVASVQKVTPTMTEASREGIRIGVETSLIPLVADVHQALKANQSQVASTTGAIVGAVAGLEESRRVADQQLSHYLDTAVVAPVTDELGSLFEAVERLDDDIRHFAKHLTQQTEPLCELLERTPGRLGTEVKVAMQDLQPVYTQALEGVRLAVDQLTGQTSEFHRLVADATATFVKNAGVSAERHEALRHGLSGIAEHLRLTEAEHGRVRAAIEQWTEKLAAVARESSEQLLSGLGERVTIPIVDSFSTESARSTESRNQLATTIAEKIGAVHGELRDLGGVLMDNEERTQAN